MVEAEKLLEMLATSEHLPDPLPESPLELLHEWYRDAIAAAQSPNPDAMVLSTTGLDGFPNARVVLCKRVDPLRGTLVFFTSATSNKIAEASADPRAAAVFHWDHLGRQARVRGHIFRAPERESDEYFASRPLLARLGAWASEQSQPVDSPLSLVGRVLETMVQFRVAPEDLARGDEIAIPRPPHWSGFHLKINSVELWIGRAGRLHDRARWTRNPSASSEMDPPPWRSTRLQP